MQRRDLLRAIGCGILAGVTGIATPTVPFEPRARLGMTDAKEAVVGSDGTFVIVAAETGFVVADVSDPAEPRLVAEQRDLLADQPGGPLRDIQDVSIDENRVLVVGPAHRQNERRVRAALVYDVSTPAAPAQLGIHETRFPIHNAAIADEYCYLTTTNVDGNPLVVLKLSENLLQEAGRWSPLDHSSEWDAVSPALFPLHDVTIQGNRAYCSYWDAGTWILDISTPEAPTYLGRVGGRPPQTLAAIDDADVGAAALELPGNHHSTAVSDDGSLLAVGKEAWSHQEDGRGPGGIELWDVADPSSPRFLSAIAPPPTPDATVSGVWTTAHNFDIQDGRLYSAWYQGGVKIHDIITPTDPIELAAWRQSDTTRFWTAQKAATCMIATSMGIDEHAPALYTFPHEVAQQTTENGQPPHERSPATTTPTGSGDSGSHGSGDTTPPATTTPGQHGAGILTTLVGLGGALSLFRRLHRATDATRSDRPEPSNTKELEGEDR